jgi:small subunit ribosomal protein S1
MSENAMDDIFLKAMQSEVSSKSDQQESRRSNVVQGTVVSVTSSDLFLDLGGKSEAVVPLSEFVDKPKLGDVVDVVLKEMKDGVNIGSKLEADKAKKMNDIRKAFEEGLPVSGAIDEVIRKDGIPKGFNVDLGLAIKAFLPFSQMGMKKGTDPDTLKGMKSDFAVIELRRGSITLSRREFLNNTIKKLYTAFFEKRQVGDVLHGQVERVEQNFLVLASEGIRVFMYVADFSWKFLADLRKVVEIGDEMEVKILSMDPAKNSVKVGKKQLMSDPWLSVEGKYEVNSVVQGKVIGFRREGAIIEIEDGVEAFLPNEELSWTERVRDPKRILQPGMIVTVKIKNVDIERRRMDLSFKEVQENPWDSAEDTYSYGRKLSGVITSIVDFGVFVKFEDGIEGLLRKEDVDWSDQNVDLKKRFKKGDAIEAVVLALDRSREKLRLGIKQLSENPLKSFSMNYPKGAPVLVKVTAIQDQGILVSLPDGLEGFIHISQLAKDKVEKVEDAAKVGDEFQACVKFVDSARNKIELSRKEYLLHEDKKDFERYMVDSSQGADNTPTIGSLMKAAFDNIKVEKGNGK